MVVDAIFDDPRLARVYDELDPARDDLDVYAGLVVELGVRSVLDVGCGTGALACTLAGRGIEVVALDPAAAMLEVAQTRRGADAVRWIHGDVTTVPVLQVDAALMTANVAQVFLTDDAWRATLLGVRRALRPEGWLVFETRIPMRRAWESWTPERTFRAVDVPGMGVVERWEEVVDVSDELVTFRTMTAFAKDHVAIESTSTLRFRDRPEIEASLLDSGFEVFELRDAPDRPGLEYVFVARRNSGHTA